MHEKKSPLSWSLIKNLSAETIKLGVGSNLNKTVVGVKSDAGAPIRAYRFSSEEAFLLFEIELKSSRIAVRTPDSTSQGIVQFGELGMRPYPFCVHSALHPDDRDNKRG